MIYPQHIGGVKGGKKCELTNSGCSRYIYMSFPIVHATFVGLVEE